MMGGRVGRGRMVDEVDRNRVFDPFLRRRLLCGLDRSLCLRGRGT
jgi:hypothetical protein